MSLSPTELAQQHAELSARVTELEQRLAFQDDLVTALNTTVAEQDRLIARMEEKLQVVGRRLQELQGPQIASMADETPPPHY